MTFALALAAVVASGAAAETPSDPVPPPTIAYHQHLISPATATLIKQPRYDGAALIRDLDDAGIDRAVVLSMGYTFADDRKAVADPDRAVRAENDWTAREIAGSRGRLIGFCSVNPLRAAALAEIARCTRLPGMRGLKLHFGNSGVSLQNPAHARRLAAVFAAANARHAPIVVHMRSRGETPYGREDAQVFLDMLLRAAPDVIVQVAHLAGSGAFPDDAEQAMAVFADAIVRHDPRTRRLYFDVTSVALPDSTAADGARIAAMIRTVGPARVLFGSDLPVGGNARPGEAWRIFRSKVPLDEAEFRAIATNLVAYIPARTSR